MRAIRLRTLVDLGPGDILQALCDYIQQLDVLVLTASKGAHTPFERQAAAAFGEMRPSDR